MITTSDWAWLQALADWFETVAAQGGPVKISHPGQLQQTAKTLRRIAQSEQPVDELERWYQEVGCGSGKP